MELKYKILYHTIDKSKTTINSVKRILNFESLDLKNLNEQEYNELCDLITDIDLIREINAIQKERGFVYKSPEFTEKIINLSLSASKNYALIDHQEKSIQKINESFSIPELHPHSKPILLSSEIDNTVTCRFSFVISTIINKTHKLEKMMDEGILDITFVRVDHSGDIKWYFDGNSTPRRDDRLTKELEEKTKNIRKPWVQKAGRGLLNNRMFLDEFIKDAPRQKPKELKESEVPKATTRNTNFSVHNYEFPKDRKYYSTTLRTFFNNLFARSKK